MKVELNDVNVYVGEVGSAFVNVVNARREYEAAVKNVKDAEFIHKRAQNLISQCSLAIDEATNVQNNAIKASNLLTKTIDEVSASIAGLNDLIDTTTVPEQKQQYRKDLNELKIKLNSLKVLQNEVLENDYDMNLHNGGSVTSATDNLLLLTNTENNSGAKEIAEDVAVKALELKTTMEAYSAECFEAIDKAEQEFEAWLTDDEDATQNNIADALELKYTRLLDKVEELIKDADEINAAIEGTSEYITEKVNSIIDGIEYKGYAKVKLADDVMDQIVEKLSDFTSENGAEIADYISTQLKEAGIEWDENVYKFEFVEYPTGIKSIALKWTFETKIPEGNTVKSTRTILDILNAYADGIFVQGLAEDANLRLSIDSISLINSVIYALGATQDTEHPEYYSIINEQPTENSQEVLDAMVVPASAINEEGDTQYSVLDAIENIGTNNDTEKDKAIIDAYISRNMQANDKFVVDINEHENQQSLALFLVRNIITPTGETIQDKSSLVEVFSVYKNGIFVLPYSNNANVNINSEVKNEIDTFLRVLNAIPSKTINGVYSIINTKKPTEGDDSDIDITPGSTI